MNGLNYLFLMLMFFCSCAENNKTTQEEKTINTQYIVEPMDKRFLSLRFNNYSKAKSAASKTEIFTLRGANLVHEDVLVGSSGNGNKNEKKEKTLAPAALEKIEAYLKEHFSSVQSEQIANADSEEVLEIKISVKWGSLSFEHQLSGATSVSTSDLYKKMDGLSTLLKQAMAE